MFFDCEDGKVRSELDEEMEKIIKRINDALDTWCIFLNKNEEENAGLYMKAINYQPHCIDRNKWEFLTYDEYEKRMPKKIQAVGRCEEAVPVMYCDSSDLTRYQLAEVGERLHRLEVEDVCCAEACPSR